MISDWVGKVVQFRYNGGSTPGTLRTVYVQSTSINSYASMLTWDFDKEAMRRFDWGKVHHIKLVDEKCFFIRPSVFPITVEYFDKDVRHFYDKDKELDIYLRYPLVEELVLTAEMAKKVVFGDHTHWETVTDEAITGKSRWLISYECVSKHIPTDKYYRFEYSKGATEQQDEQPFDNYTTYSPIEVVKKDILRKEWVTVE